MILADEPIASLDPLNAAIVMDALQEINTRDGITVMCNLHTLDTARTYCSRVVGMLAGRVVFDGPAAELTDARVREIYGAEGEAELSEAVTSTALPVDAPRGAASYRPAAARSDDAPVRLPHCRPHWRRHGALPMQPASPPADDPALGAPPRAFPSPPLPKEPSMTILKTALLGTLALAALTTTPAVAQDADGVFRIGIIGGENEADRLRNFQCLVDALPEAIDGVESVKLFPAADYDGTIQGLLGGTLDYAELGASGYAKIFLEDENAVDPILTTVQTDGATGYYSVMVTRADSGIESLEDLEGRSLGFADPDSTSGYLIPLVSLPQEPALGGRNFEQFFSETGFGGGHENNVLAVIDGKFDAGVTWASGVGEFEDGYSSGNLRKMVDKGLVDMDDLRQIWQSPQIPNGPIVVSNTVKPEVKAQFKQFMMDLPTSDPDCFQAIQGGEYASFTEVDPSFYQTIIDARRAQIGG